MRNYKRALLAGCTALLAVPALAQNPAAAPGDARDSGSTEYQQSLSYRDYLRGHNLRASELIGAQVRNPDGETLGEIKELIIASGNDMIVLSVGGVLNVGGKLVAVPYEDLRVSPDGETLYMNRTHGELEAAPAYSYEEQTAQPQPQRSAAAQPEQPQPQQSAAAPVARATDDQGADRAAAAGEETAIQREVDEAQREIQRESNEAQRQIQRAADAANEAQREVPRESESAARASDAAVQQPRAAVPARPTPEALTALDRGDYRGSEIIGATVLDSTGENVAEVDDLVVSTDDKKIHAVLSVGGVAGIGAKLISIPLDELKISPVGEDQETPSLRVEATADELESKPVFRYERQVALAEPDA